MRTTGRVVIDRERCKGCGLCVEVCPPAVLRSAQALNASGHHPVELIENDARACTGCAICALVCPDVAITVIRRPRQ